MDEFENIIAKYMNELKEFSAQNTHQIKAEEKEAATAVFAQAADPAPEQPAAAPAQENTTVQPAEEQPTVIFNNYADFLKSNPQKGVLKFQVYAANQAFPVVNARVTVYLKLSDGNREMFDGLTDINGIIDNIVLPAPDKAISQSPDNSAIPYSAYSATVEHPDFSNVSFVNIPVFSGIKSIQGVEMIPMTESARINGTRTYTETTPFFRLNGGESNGNTDNS
ncbi:MAG: hypothetical protein ACI4RB_01070 [Acutalibacteraceae bacterium]